MTIEIKGKKILVTGSEGFIGSHLVEKLVHEGVKVKAFVLYNSFNSWGWLDSLPSSVRNEVEIFCGDIRDPNSVRQAVKGCDIVAHLAALIGIPYSYLSPDAYIDTNVKGTLNILQAARDFEIEHVLHTSTSEVYGTAKYVPICEEHPLQAQSPYSASKIAADHLALSFYNAFMLPVSIIRPFNTYGPRQSARAVIPTVITQLASGSPELHLGNLHPTRDFNYVLDTVNGFVCAIKQRALLGEVVNLGSNFEVSILDTVKLIAELMGKEFSMVGDEQRIRPKKSEVERLFSSNDKALKNLKWAPAYGGLEGFKNGLSLTIDWFSDKKNLEYYKSGIYNL